MNNGRPLNSEEQSFIDELKRLGILLNLNLPEVIQLVGVWENVVAFLCSDDHTDMTSLLREMVAAYVHPVRVFGGPLTWAKSYGKVRPKLVCWQLRYVIFWLWNNIAWILYRGISFFPRLFIRQWILQNIIDGMNHKKAGAFVPKFHVPCGMGDKYGHTVKDILRMIGECNEFILSVPYFDSKRVLFMLHTKRINEVGKMVQNTYLVDISRLEEYLKKSC